MAKRSRKQSGKGIRSIPKSVSIEELIRQQGVKPVTDLDALGRLLPEDFDPDGFAAFIAEERAIGRGFKPRRKTA